MPATCVVSGSIAGRYQDAVPAFWFRSPQNNMAGGAASGDASDSVVAPPLPQFAAYIVVVVIGFIFAAVMIGITHILKRLSALVSRVRPSSRRGSGMHVIAATFLLPVGVILYTFVGGVKATFLTDYVHTFIITIIICFFTIKALLTSEISSPAHLYELIVAAGEAPPVSGNHNGSYLTMTSHGAMLFGIIHVLANFGLVVMDTGFFVKAFAARPQAVVPGYVIGGIAYFGIPWCLGTLMSFVALGLEGEEIFPTYPRRMSGTEISNGLVLPYAAIAIAGKGGATAILLITFMAVTSTLSAQVIAVSSIISFDIYRQYINKAATDRDVIRWSHIGVVFFGLFSACFSTVLHYGKVDLGWTLYMLGVLTCPGIFPTTFAILWKKQSTVAAVVSPILGLFTGLAVWLGTAQALFGEISVASTGQAAPCTWGTTASALSPALYSVVISLVKPANFNWADFRNEKLTLDGTAQNVEESDYQTNKAQLKRWGRLSAYWSLATFLGHWVLWPLPMYAAKYVFSESFFVAWLVLAIIWVWITMFVAGFFPIIDGRKQILDVIQTLRGRSKKPETSESEGPATPTESVAYDQKQ
ncbi:urea active transporter 1 like protein [Verticillium longisporum]|nr:urea active transporter 1 like protein [Verticillium longisporum]